MSESTLFEAPPSFAGFIGAAREDITPPVGIYARNWGAAEHDTAEGVHRPLTCTALTLQSPSGGDPLVLIVMDLGWWRTRDSERFVRGHLLDALGLDPARALISFTHTHAGPSVTLEDADQPGGRLIRPYLERVREAAVRATRAALENRREAILSFATGRCTLARHRDLPDPEGSRTVCGYDPGGAADDTLLVGQVTAEDGTVIATLANYACHPVTLAWQNRLISPDFVGAMRETVEGRTGGAPCLFLQGASGELAPREVYTGDPAVADSHGRELGYAVLSALEGMLPHRTALKYGGVVESGAPLAVWERVPFEPSRRLEAVKVEVELPLKADLPSLADLDAQLKSCADRYQAERLARKRRIRVDVGAGETTPMPLWVWRVGDVVFLANPNEAYSQLQTELRGRFPDLALVVMNVTNGHTGYLPPADLYDLDLYQVWQTPYDRGSLEHVIESGSRVLEDIGR
ncbi:MAG: hypothetical protein KY468_05325 [Armatimonadetes bacterium]|nr:hypothetical protein [Armatimonadota bacterium]